VRPRGRTGRTPPTFLRKHSVDSSERLYRKLAEACPYVSASIGTMGVSPSVKFEPAASATPAQIAAAQSVIDTFDWSDAANQNYAASLEPDLITLKNQVTAALTAIQNFLALVPPLSLTQLAAEVRAIDQRQQAILKALARLVAKAGL
jgi:hypothetical protein